MLGVEDLGDKQNVDFVVALAYILRTNYIVTADLLRVVNANLGACNIVLFIESIEIALCIIKLVQHIEQFLAILQVFAEIRDRFLTSIL